MTGADDALAGAPMANGELLFEAPWESRVFGMAHALAETGLFSWDEFREYLIAEIAAWEDAHPDGAAYRYYERFQQALERLLTDQGVVPSAVLAERSREYEARPHDHDHTHGHHDTHVDGD